MAQYTANENLYKWSTSDTKQTTITETALNAEKIDAKLNDHTAQLADMVINVKKPPAPFVGAKSDFTDDCTSIIQGLIDTYKNVYVPPGRYKILGTINITGGDKKLHLSAGATLEKPADAVNTDPIIHMTSMFASLTGDGQATSTIKQLCDSPRGIVSIGDLDPSNPKTVAVGYNTFSNVMLWGKGSNTTGTPNYGLYMCNLDTNGMWSYYHIIQNLQIRYVNVGIGLTGNANANIINNITLTVVGNEKYISGYDSGILMVEQAGVGAPLDNAISNIFHTGSNNAITLLLNGNCKSNSISNLNSEVGGSGGTWVKSINDSLANGNLISGVSMNAGGYGFTDTFLSNNTVMLGGVILTTKELRADTKLTTKLVNTNDMTLNGYETKDAVSLIRKYSVRTNLLQNTTYKLFDFDLGSSALEKFVFTVNVILSRGVAFIRRAVGFRFSIDNSTKVNEILDYVGSSPVDMFFEPVITGNIVSVYAKIPNNGTGQLVTMKAEVTVDGAEASSLTDLTMATDLTTYTPAAVQMYLSKSGPTSKRYAYEVGQRYLDTTLWKETIVKQVSPPIWIDAMGATV